MSNTTSNQPAATTAPGGAWEEVKPPFNLENGALYAATIQLSGFEKIASTQTIANKIQSAGFSNVTCTSDKQRVEGTWNRPDQNGVPLPTQIRQVWRWRAAPAAASVAPAAAETAPAPDSDVTTTPDPESVP
jgi:hypothetical protein